MQVLNVLMRAALRRCSSRRESLTAGSGFLCMSNVIGRATMILYSAKGPAYAIADWRAERYFQWIR